jgi:hypothetical protein
VMLKLVRGRVFVERVGLEQGLRPVQEPGYAHSEYTPTREAGDPGSGRKRGCGLVQEVQRQADAAGAVGVAHRITQSEQVQLEVLGRGLPIHLRGRKGRRGVALPLPSGEIRIWI